MSMKEETGVPLMESPVCCGFPSPAEHYSEGALDLNELLVRHPAATYFLRAAGESMTGAGIRSGDILVVDRSLPAVNGAIVIACIDNEFTVKYFHADEHGVSLIPANRRFKPVVLSGAMELKLFGVVTAVIHQYVRSGAAG